MSKGRKKGIFQKMNKIFYLSSSSENHTGSPKALLDLVNNLDRTFYSPALMVPQDGSLAQDFRNSYGEVFYKQSLSLSNTNVFPYLKSIKEFWSFFKENQISLLHFNGIGWRDSVVVAARMARVPVLLNLHNPYPENEIKGNFNFYLANKIVIVSNSMRKNFSKHPRILKKISCIHNGVDLKCFGEGLGNIRHSLPVDDDGLVIGYVGQLCKRKGIDLLIKASPAVIGHFPGALFVIAGADGVGEEGYTESLRALAAELGVGEHFVFIGKRDDVPDVMNACDLLVVPSRAEPFGKVIIEAMACGKCVIASAVGGIPEIIQDGYNGLLVPTENVEALRDAMLKVLADNKLRNTLAREGNCTAKEQFSIDALVDKTQSVYSQLLNNTESNLGAGAQQGGAHDRTNERR